MKVRTPLAAVLAAGLISAPATAIAATGGKPAHPHHQMGCRQLERLWVSQGGRPRAARKAASVAMEESGGDWWVTSWPPGGGKNEGLWQINTRTGLAAYGPRRNARAAITLSRNGRDWSGWVAHAATGCE